MHFWDQHKTITRYYEILMSSVCEKYQLKHLEYDILMFFAQQSPVSHGGRYRQGPEIHQVPRVHFTENP